MSKKKENYLNIVQELNQLIFDQSEKLAEVYCFIYHTNGYLHSITFNEEIIWNSENDEREYIELIDEYEDLLPFIKRQFANMINDLNKLQFKL